MMSNNDSTKTEVSVMNVTTLSDKVRDLPSFRVDVDADDESSCGNHSEEGGLNFSDSDPKDSGVDCDPNNAESLPDEETASSILKMVEFYLSDENILKDPFLLKHVRRNKEGYVSVKLLASFRKVRSLCRNWKAVAYSVQKSKLLALNSDGTKVRRLTPLPDHDETATSRSVIVHGFKSDRPSVDGISELFAQCGDIALVRILRPGGSVPAEVKRFLSKNPDLQSKTCALVEFEEHAFAKKALESEQVDGIKVVPILLNERNKPSSPKKNVPVAAIGESMNQSSTITPKESPKKKKKNRKGSNAEKKSADGVKNLIVADDQKRTRRSSSGSMSSQSSGYLSSSPGNTSGFLDSRYPRRHTNPSIYNDRNSSFASLNSRYNGSRDRLQRTGTEGSNTLSPWRQRREQMMQSDSNLAAFGNNSSVGISLLQSLPVKTIRSPRGPDGTKGFLPRSRLPSTAE